MQNHLRQHAVAKRAVLEHVGIERVKLPSEVGISRRPKALATRIVHLHRLEQSIENAQETALSVLHRLTHRRCLSSKPSIHPHAVAQNGRAGPSRLVPHARPCQSVPSVAYQASIRRFRSPSQKQVLRRKARDADVYWSTLGIAHGAFFATSPVENAAPEVLQPTYLPWAALIPARRPKVIAIPWETPMMVVG